MPEPEDRLEAFGATDRGRRRAKNEDQFLIADLTRMMQVRQSSLTSRTEVFPGDSRGVLLAVADGIGGHADGERASALAVASLTHYVLNCQRWFFRLNDHPDDDFLDDLRNAIGEAEGLLQDESQDQSGKRMGTTLTLGYLVWPRLYVVHVGDSRCYVLRGGQLEQITTDHTLAQVLAESQNPDASPSDTAGRRVKHVLTNAIGGTRDEVRPDVFRTTVEAGDLVMVCTDGLTGHVSDAEIQRVLLASDSLQDACDSLVKAANDAGGHDNVTVVLCRATPAAARPLERPLVTDAKRRSPLRPTSGPES